MRSLLPSRLAAAAFAVAAAFHLLALAVPAASTPSPPWRHALLERGFHWVQEKPFNR